MKLTKERQGEAFIFIEASLWALFPILTIISYNKVSPLISLGISTIFATVFFAIVLTVKKKWHEITNTSAFKDILLTTLFIGIFYYLLYFFGLQYTSAGNASIITKIEIFFSYLLFNIWKKDNLPPKHIAGAVLMVIGALIVLYPNLHVFKLGDLLILAAAFFPPFGNFFARRAREKVSSETIMFYRSIISSAVIFLLIFIFKNTFSYSDLKDSFIVLLIIGVFLLGLSKILWIEGIMRISVVKANALGSISPLLTLLFAWIFLRDIPTHWQLLSLIPIFFGIILLGMNGKESTS
ncbi:DMT family transporter [Patescibacteria group bacterium]|nr:DMT family transporter [Patescibacteria group bacterium]MBU4016966.1 DMT family transporter [Patescibacteria group bacterium]MBU4099411.1 DMT family transporter [Patescibacteria group bacterium]